MERQITEAAREMAFLYVFSTVVGALENGTISGPASSDALKIIKIAKSAMQKCLRRYDAKVDKLTTPTERAE